jgi:hypothetical protein
MNELSCALTNFGRSAGARGDRPMRIGLEPRGNCRALGRKVDSRTSRANLEQLSEA